MRPRIKICGVTSASQAEAAAEAGVDALGLVFHPNSPRAITLSQAVEISRAIPAFVSVVGLFMDPEKARVNEVLARVPLEMLQFHGRESAAFCRAFGRRYIKALGMSGGVDPMTLAGEYEDAAALLLDSHAGNRAGGTGEVFDWQRLPQALQRPLVLAGGLSPGNVARAVEQVRPWGVDVSSGVESAPGVKDPVKMSHFINEVHRVC
ncbi:phosphoribosylanthranilate isomerase [Natronospira proteinivora]|uniref:N-(5'-phosphoribosyl)anthranilate isomerase n=1 Tax=Natronospira proteinivora TaxID=1807133 RepID=A0ABT1GB31_9GAMM|nr:phosphoribosylanthranilate isomerase [Natronospira proteinivora]MCP1727102.1 phosphoribosylanthranilate isomerase [Natronospira proteinivora]